MKKREKLCKLGGLAAATALRCPHCALTWKGIGIDPGLRLLLIALVLGGFAFGWRAYLNTAASMGSRLFQPPVALSAPPSAAPSPSRASSPRAPGR